MSNNHYFGMIVLAVTLSVGSAFQKTEAEASKQFFEAMDRVDVDMTNAGPCTVRQESIDLAMMAYSIRIPPDTDWPIIDMNLTDRGLTSTRFFGHRRIFIGPNAFQSWSVLGSTLAHEIEVHAHQNMKTIALFDLFGFDGTGLAEQEAYTHELQMAARTRLTIGDQEVVRSTRDFYYPGHRGLGAKALEKVFHRVAGSPLTQTSAAGLDPQADHR